MAIPDETLDLVTFVSEYKSHVTGVNMAHTPFSQQQQLVVVGVGTKPARHTRRVAVTVTLLALCVVGRAATALGQQTSADATKNSDRPTVLFMCPHGAAKSFLASAYFQRLARERGLNVRVESAGTDPDPDVAPAVANHLKAKGYEAPTSKPRRASADDMAAADVVVSIGCDLKDLPAPTGTLVKWDDVPALSENFEGADKRIREQVIQLVDELLRKQQH
jgi:arsenate reductase